MKNDKYKIIEPFLKKEKKLKELSSEHNISYSTLKRWIKAYKETGMKGLVKKTRSDKDSFRKADSEIMKYIVKEHKKNPNINITTLYNNYLKVFKNKDLKKLSYNTIYRIATNLDPFSQKYVKKNLKNIEKPNDIYRISTEKMYIKNLGENNGVVTIIIIYDVYDDSILNYKIYSERVVEAHYLRLIRDTLLENRIDNYLVVPQYIFIDDFKITNKERYFEILKELSININGALEKNHELTKFVRFLEKDIVNLFGKEAISIDSLNDNLKEYICNKVLKNIEEKNKLFDLTKLDYLFESSNRKIQNYGIRFKNNLYNDKILKDYLGNIVTLRYNPFDLSFLNIYLDEKFLFTLYKV